MTLDHPAYNRGRGPASILAVRLHAKFQTGSLGVFNR